ncbi:MAG: hypothetical protein OEZ06_01500 [Myxococcales bacterium]|nr:hypothetical protein [Myxococcales bacterium]
MGHRNVATVLAVSLAGLCACAPGTPAPQSPRARGPRAMHYRFALDPKLETLTAQLCFEGPAPSRLVCGVDWGKPLLMSARQTTSDGQGIGGGLPGDGALDLSALGDDACLEYEVDLAATAPSFGPARTRRSGGAVVTNLSSWLWRPPGWRSVPRVSARFALPEGVEVSLPWPEEDGVYQLDATAFAYLGYAVFGRFQRERFRVPGAEIEVAVLDGLPDSLHAAIRPWLETAARMATQPAGRFPHERAQIVVIPSGPRDAPVGFGHATRSGGPSVAIFLPTNSELERMKPDWVAVHELSHFLHPFVQRGDAWLSEGLATYYQEVLRVRAGLHSPDDAFRRLWQGAERGREASGSLSDESRQMYSKFNFPMVYWAGAAFALMADVELRKRSRGPRSLDEVLAELSSCCTRGDRPWPARKVLERMDEIVGEPLLSRLAERWVEGPTMPDLSEVYRKLGIRVDDGGQVHYDGAPDAIVRDAIMGVDKQLAREIEKLGAI